MTNGESTHEAASYGEVPLRILELYPGSPTALLVPEPPPPLTATDITDAISELPIEGFKYARTSAVTESEATPFLNAGFEVIGELALLATDMSTRIEHPKVRLRRGHRFDYASVLDLDRLCFPDLWRFTQPLLRDALYATATSQFRIAGLATPNGYAITGATGKTSYLQRLAVHPEDQGRGLGAALVADAVKWAKRRGAESMLVNTSVDNDDALGFYDRLGFKRQQDTLLVLERSLLR